MIEELDWFITLKYCTCLWLWRFIIITVYEILGLFVIIWNIYNYQYDDGSHDYLTLKEL